MKVIFPDEVALRAKVNDVDFECQLDGATLLDSKFDDIAFFESGSHVVLMKCMD